MYSIGIRPELEIRGSLPLIVPEPERRGVCQCQLLMTEDEGCIFMEYTVVAMDYMIYGMLHKKVCEMIVRVRDSFVSTYCEVLTT